MSFLWWLKHVWHGLTYYYDGPAQVMHCARCRKGYVK